MSKRVLIVEDSNVVRLTIRRALELHNMEVLELSSAEDLINYLGQFRDIALLILDINLPGVDGITALEKIKAEKKWAYIPVLITTGRADKKTVIRALQAGAVGYLRKPFSAEQLIERVKHIIGPIYSSEENSIITEEQQLKTIIRHEVMRAERGGNTFSVVEIVFSRNSSELASFKGDIIKLDKKLKDLLREIDLVFITAKWTLMIILPLADCEGAAMAYTRIEKEISIKENINIEYAIANYPVDGRNEKEILKDLEAKLFAQYSP